MPTPLPKGQQIVVSHIRMKAGYHMDSMQMATDHYNIGITLQGHRTTITPAFSYSYQQGDVALMPPYLFHRTLAQFNEPYERIMIKFSPAFAEPFIRQMGQHSFNQLYETPVYHFSDESQRGCCFVCLQRFWKNIFQFSQPQIRFRFPHRFSMPLFTWKIISKSSLPWRK